MDPLIAIKYICKGQMKYLGYLSNDDLSFFLKASKFVKVGSPKYLFAQEIAFNIKKEKMIPAPEVNFYNPKGPYGYMSNYYGKTEDKNFKLKIDGKDWASTEHYYQAMKFTGSDNIFNKEYIETIRKAKTANISRILALQKVGGGYKWRTDLNPIIKLANDNGVKIRDDWDSVKDDFMRKALIYKFSQNEKLRLKLLSTGDQIIAEDSPRDSYWGVGKNKDGKNMLGILLMETRQKIV